jgi:hypothetical protein
MLTSPAMRLLLAFLAIIFLASSSSCSAFSSSINSIRTSSSSCSSSSSANGSSRYRISSSLRRNRLSNSALAAALPSSIHKNVVTAGSGESNVAVGDMCTASYRCYVREEERGSSDEAGVDGPAAARKIIRAQQPFAGEKMFQFPVLNSGALAFGTCLQTFSLLYSIHSHPTLFQSLTTSTSIPFLLSFTS